MGCCAIPYDHACASALKACHTTHAQKMRMTHSIQMLTREFDRVCCKVDDDEPHIEFANYSRYDRFINLSSVTVYQTYVRLCDCKYMTPVVYTSYAVGNWQNAFDSMYMDTPVGPFPPQTLIDMLNRGDGNNNGIWYKLITHVLWAGARVRLLLLRELLAETCADLYGLIAQHFIVFF